MTSSIPTALLCPALTQTCVSSQHRVKGPQLGKTQCDLLQEIVKMIH